MSDPFRDPGFESTSDAASDASSPAAMQISPPGPKDSPNNPFVDRDYHMSSPSPVAKRGDRSSEAASSANLEQKGSISTASTYAENVLHPPSLAVDPDTATFPSTPPRHTGRPRYRISGKMFSFVQEETTAQVPLPRYSDPFEGSPQIMSSPSPHLRRSQSSESIRVPEIEMQPYGPIVESEGTTVFELLQTMLPDTPRYYIEPTETGKRKVLASTKAITETVLRVPFRNRLQKIVYAPDMFDDVMVELYHLLSTTAMTIDWSKKAHVRWVEGVHPYATSARLPQVIHSEKDIEAYFYGVILRPALAVILALKSGEIPGDQHAEFPFLSSSVQQTTKGAVVPDVISVSEGRYPNEKIACRGEVKCFNVIHTKDDTGIEHILRKLQVHGPNFPLGYAIRFKWPRTTGGHNVQTKVLTQVRNLYIHLTGSDSAPCTSCGNRLRKSLAPLKRITCSLVTG